MSETNGNGYAKPGDLFQPMKRKFTDVAVEGLGKFRLRDLTAEEAAGYAAERFNKSGELIRNSLVTANARIAVLCCVDEDGNQIFSRDDVHKLQGLPAGQLAKLAENCLSWSGLDDEEEAAKN